MTTIMQPFQCDLQPQIQEMHRTTHTGTTTRCRTQRRNQNDYSHNRRTQEIPFIAGCSHFTRASTRSTRFRALASSPKQSPCNIHIHAAITIRFAASRSKPASLSAHGTTKWQQSYSHYTSVLLCDVKSHTTLHWVYCYVMSSLTPRSHTTLHWAHCYVMLSLTPPFIECILMWCQISHHPSLSVLLWDVKSHTTLHWVYCYVM